MRTGLPAAAGHSSSLPAPGWRSALACAALLAAVVLAPPALAGSLPGTGSTSLVGLPQALDDAFPTWWASQQVHLSTPLQQLVTYWAWFHTIKAIASAALLAALVWVVARTWRASTQNGMTGRARPRPLGTAGAVLAAALTPLALVVVVANLQGALAPLSSVLTFLNINAAPGASGGASAGAGAGGASAGGVSVAAGQIRHALLTGTTPPPVQVLVDDFRLYHLVLAVGAGVVCLTLLVGVTMMVLRGREQGWRRAGDRRCSLSGHGVSMRPAALRRRVRRSARKASSVVAGRTATTLGASDQPGGPARVLVGVSGVLAVGMLAFFALVGAANISTVASTAPALAEFFSGSGL